MRSPADEVAVITGGSRGIGLAIAEGLAGTGVTTVIASRDASRVVAQASRIQAATGSEVRGMRLDVAERDECLALIDEVRAAFGCPTILVNAAGIYVGAPFLDYSADDLERMMRVNFYGAFHMMQGVLPDMIDAQFGRIINVASSAGKWASRNQAGYNSSKHALIGLTRCVAMEVAKSGVTVNAICPGLVATELLDELYESQARLDKISVSDAAQRSLSRVSRGVIAQPEEVAHLAVYLASEAAAAMTGQSLSLDGGTLFI